MILSRVVFPWETPLSELHAARAVGVPRPTPEGLDRPILTGSGVRSRREVYERVLSGGFKVIVFLDALFQYGFSPPKPPLYVEERFGVVLWGDEAERLRIIVAETGFPEPRPWTIYFVPVSVGGPETLGYLASHAARGIKEYLGVRESGEYRVPGSPLLRGLLGCRYVDAPAGYVYPGYISSYLSDLPAAPRHAVARSIRDLIVYSLLYKFPAVVYRGEESRA